jgi:hypothetical protein
MKFGRKSKNSSARAGAAPAGTSSPTKRQAAYELGENTGSDGLPGLAGYANGPRTALPTFFSTRRPDGRPDQPLPKKKFFG